MWLNIVWVWCIRNIQHLTWFSFTFFNTYNFQKGLFSSSLFVIYKCDSPVRAFPPHVRSCLLFSWLCKEEGESKHTPSSCEEHTARAFISMKQTVLHSLKHMHQPQGKTYDIQSEQSITSHTHSGCICLMSRFNAADHISHVIRLFSPLALCLLVSL